ncbi:HD domain-containing protein [Algoriphagus halophytocola]|uniref:HD domain-containing protein n=1 Tax=Algoriphagus halophytocola TaxID=2991499 RepID=A0ABY6MKQ6_9BACT|nr:HD domain-containing protein [Algoriphagus sp. TR-M5]UZD24243.1 hypothetical protein OM944_07020 [Algoriphagus sp. TR-M5]
MFNKQVDKLLLEIEYKTRELFDTALNPEVCYHNLDHTLSIVNQVGIIGGFYDLPQEQQEDLTIAGWLHDIGYLQGVAQEHEKRGAAFAGKLLASMSVEPCRINRVQGAILATKVPQQPQNLLECIICDADLYHLSSDQFYEQTLTLKKENEQLNRKKWKLAEWLRNSEQFMKQHRYHSEYAKEHFLPGKLANLEFLQAKIKELES